MSANAKGTAEIEFKKDRFTQNVNSAKTAITDLGNKGKDALSTIATKSRDAVAGLDKVKSSTDKTTASMRNMNSAAKQSSIDLKVTGLAAAGAAASAFSLVQGLTATQTKMLDIKKINLDVEKSQEAVNRMVEEGKKGTKEYEFALKDLQIKQEEQKIKNDELNASYAQMGFSLIAMASTTIPLVIQGLNALKASRLAGAAATGVGAAANVGFTASLASTTAAIWANTVSLLSNPFFAIGAAAAIAAAVALIATNTWGLRDSIFASTEAVKESTKAANMYSDEIATVTEETESLKGSMEKLVETTDGPMVAYWDKRRKEVSAFYEELRLANGMVNAFSSNQKKSFASLRDFGATATQAVQSISVADAKIRTLQEKIIAANLAGIGGGNAVTLENSLNARNISGNSILAQAVAGLKLTRGPFGRITSNIDFGTSSSFASSQGGGPGNTSRRTGTSRAQSGVGGSPNRHDNAQLRAAANKIRGTNSQSLSLLTGIDLLTFDNGMRALPGRSWTDIDARNAGLESLRNRVAEANTRVSIMEQLQAFSAVPQVQSLFSGNSGFKMSSSQLQQVLSDQKSKANSYATTLGLTQASISDLYGTSSGFFDLNNMLAFHERNMMEMNSVG